MDFGKGSPKFEGRVAQKCGFREMVPQIRSLGIPKCGFGEGENTKIGAGVPKMWSWELGEPQNLEFRTWGTPKFEAGQSQKCGAPKFEGRGEQKMWHLGKVTTKPEGRKPKLCILGKGTSKCGFWEKGPQNVDVGVV